MSDAGGGAVPPTLHAVLEDARRLGFLGPGPVGDHERHAVAMAEFVGSPGGPVLDLGSGGGVPGLVLAARWPDVEVVMLDAMHRRCRFAREAVEGLDLGSRVRVVEGRAEVLARDPGLREQFAVVVARGFGPPAVAAECGVAFIRPDGRLVVSEPPGGSDARWPGDVLATLGLVLGRRFHGDSASFVELRRTGELDARWPRRTGVPGKRPLW